jgi:hypothetical protein
MKRVIVIFLLLINTPIFSQQSFNVQFGVNLPFKYSENETFRKAGIEIGFGFMKKYENSISFETNLSANIWSRINHPYVESIEFDDPYQTIPKITYGKSSRVSFDASITSLVGYTSNRFTYKNGLEFIVRNIYTYDSKYVFNIPPEVFSTSNQYSYDFFTIVGINYCFSVAYDINDKYSPYISFRTNVIEFNYRKLNDHTYGLVSLGLNVKIANR